MQQRLNILGLSGSLREASFNTGLIRAAQEVAPMDVTVTRYDLRPIPFYDADVEAAGVPREVRDFADAIRTADALLIATPEYNHSIPALLKNAVDWVSRPSSGNPLRRKPIALMGAAAGPYGTVRAQAQWRLIFASGIEAMVMVKPDLFVNYAANKIDDTGYVFDEDTRARVAAHVQALAEWTRLVSREAIASAP